MNYTGRLDALLRTDDFFLIIEFKYSEIESLDLMLKKGENQIIKNGYYKPYQDKNPFILTIAIKPITVKCVFKSLNDVLKQYKDS